MKPSSYNHFIELKNSDIILAFNSFTGAIAEIQREQYEKVQALLARPGSAGPEDQELVQCLREGGFLVSGAVDEIRVLRQKQKSSRLEGVALTLTIAPTLACNFACDYCYEARSNVRMGPDVQDALISFADQYLDHAEVLRLCWFGGEPTLCISMIEQLQARFNEVVEKHRARMLPAIIITNGYLLDAAMAQRLCALGISQAQITIDGPKSIHDRRRKLLNGNGSFDRIIDNIAGISDIMSLNIRVNIDKDNVASAYEVVHLLDSQGVLPKVRVNFAQVTPSGTVCADIRERCHDTEEFSQSLVKIYQDLYERGIRNLNFPVITTNAGCGAVAEGYYVVSPAGHLFKCWEDLSLDAAKSVGDLFSKIPTPEQQANLERYRSWDSFAYGECRACNMLPMCMAGCPIRGLEQPQAKRGTCTSWKYNLRELFGLAYANASQQAAE